MLYVAFFEDSLANSIEKYRKQHFGVLEKSAK
jgi:hypothetical protein